MMSQIRSSPAERTAPTQIPIPIPQSSSAAVQTEPMKMNKTASS